MPLLGWPPFALLVNYFVKMYSEFLFDYVKHLIDEQKIILTNEAAKTQFVKASLELHEIVRSKGFDSKEFKEARNENKKLLDNLVRYDVAR